MRFMSTCSSVSLTGSSLPIDDHDRRILAVLHRQVKDGVVPGLAVQDPYDFLGIDRNRHGSPCRFRKPQPGAEPAARSRRASFFPRKLRGSAAIVISFAIFLISCLYLKELFYTNNVLTEPSSWIDWIALASSGATESCLMRSQLSACPHNGMELVTTTSVISELSILSTAGPESTACVAQARTLLAPCLSNASVAFTSVPAVSIKSSTIRQCCPLTSPMMCITSATFTSVRRLSMIASGESMRLANARARSTPPASGETTVNPSPPSSLK